MNRVMKFLACVALGLIGIFLIGFITMSLWNWLVPVLFNGPTLSFWQALGLLLLSKILFWGFGASKHGGYGNRHRSHDMHWKSKFYNKFSSMTPEEREQMKQKMKDKWCYWQDKPADKSTSTSND